MKISMYAPFKPLDHPHPSGDLVIGNGIKHFLENKGHDISIAHRLRSRWLYWKPKKWLSLLQARRSLICRFKKKRPDLWLTYHAYYKAPDILGPTLCRRFKLPYVIFQGIYSTKRKRKLKTLPGYILNTRSLLQADHIFTNRLIDHKNLQRIIDPQHLTYIAPGIYPQHFCFSKVDRAACRQKWNIPPDELVIASAAMFRPDVKTKGLQWLMETINSMPQPPTLIIAGDGSEKKMLTTLADSMPYRIIFTGKIPREQMAAFYSTADIFAFPGINESLGMVYLEAQSCGLPVVAFDNGGIPEVVENGKSGFLTKPFAQKPYIEALSSLTNKDFRHKLGHHAAEVIRQRHDLNHNYEKLESMLNMIVKPA